MSYSIIGTGTVGKALAAFFAKAGIAVALANTRGAETVEPVAKELGGKVAAKPLDEALEADIIFFAVQFLNFKDVGSVSLTGPARLLSTSRTRLSFHRRSKTESCGDVCHRR